MSSKLNISLKSKGTPTIDLKIGDEAKNIIESSASSPIITFVATGDKGEQGPSGSASITDNSITSVKLQDNSITTSKINDLAVTSGKIANNSITNSKIQNNSISSLKIQNNSITASKIAPGVVTTELLTDGIVTADKLGNLSITNDKLSDGVVTNVKIAENTITGSKLIDSIVLSGTTHIQQMVIDGSSPGFISGPSSDTLNIRSTRDLVFTIDYDESTQADSSSFMFKNGSGTSLMQIDENGVVAVNGSINVTGDISVNGLVDSVDILQLSTKLNYITITQAVDLDSMESKLAGIEAGAEVNVKANWNETDANSDSFIQNKPTIPTDTNTTYSVSCVDGDNSDEEKIRLTDSSGVNDDIVLEAGTGLSIARSGDKITFTNTVTDTDTVLTTEQVQDIVGAMFTSNTETRIAATYQDDDGTIDLAVDAFPADLTVDGAGTVHTNNITDLHGAGVDGANNNILTDKGDGTIASENSLTYDISTFTLEIGSDDFNTGTLKKHDHSDGVGGKLDLKAGNSGGTNTAGGDVRIYGGKGTGNALGGAIEFYVSTAGSSGDTAHSAQVVDVAITDGQLAVSGNITVSGTVDGRDVATDGTKLDGIASGATASPDLTVNGAGTIHANNVPTLNQNTTGNATSATVASTVTVTDSEAASTTYYPTLVDGLTGVQALETESELTFVANTGILTATGFAGDLTGDVTGNADTATNLTGGDKSLNGTFQSRGFIVDGNTNYTPSADGTAIHVDSMDVTDNSTSASGTTSVYNHIVFENPRLFATNTSVTTTDAATVFIKGAPFASTNQTITNNYALKIHSGESYFSGAINANGGVTGNVTGDVSGSSGSCTGNSATATNLVASTSTAVELGTIELGHASDTTIARTAAGTVAIEGNTIATTNKHKHFINFGVNLTVQYSRWLPWGSYYIYERNTNNDPEYTTYVAPYDGRFIKLVLRSEEALGSTEIKIWKVGDGTEEPEDGTVVDDKDVDIASANTSYTYTFDADATFSAGDAMAVRIDPTNDPVGAGVTGTFVLEFDLTT